MESRVRRNVRVSNLKSSPSRSRASTAPRRELLATIEELRSELKEVKRSLSAIRQGKADGLVVPGRRGGKVLTALGADQPYRILIQSMREGVAILTAEGLIAYANDALAELFGHPRDKVVGQP